MRHVAVTRAAYGTLLLFVPGAVMRIASGEPTDRASRVVARILGLRHLVQALVLERNGTRGRLLAGTAIDAVHALSMVGLAVLSRDHRWSAALDAALATALAANGLREAPDV